MENHPSPSGYEYEYEHEHEHKKEPSANVLIRLMAGRLSEWRTNHGRDRDATSIGAARADASGANSGPAKRRGLNDDDAGVGIGGGGGGEDDADENQGHRAVRARPNGSSPARVGRRQLLLQSQSAAAAAARVSTSTVAFRCRVEIHENDVLECEAFDAEVELSISTAAAAAAAAAADGGSGRSTFSIRRAMGGSDEWERMHRSLVIGEIAMLSDDPNPDDPDPTMVFLTTSEGADNKGFVFRPASDDWEAKKCLMPPLEVLVECGIPELRDDGHAAMVLGYLRQGALRAEGEVADDDEFLPPLGDDEEEARAPDGDGGETTQAGGGGDGDDDDYDDDEGGVGNGAVCVSFTLPDGEVRVEHLILDQTFDEIREDLFPPNSDLGHVRLIFNGKDVGVDQTPESLGMHEMEGDDLEVTVVTEQGGG